MKGTKRQNLALAIMVAMLLIFSMSAGISFAYFSASKTSADQTLKFGKIVVTVNDGVSDVISVTSDAKMDGASLIALSGTLGLEDGSLNAYLRIMPNVSMAYNDGTAVNASAVSEFKTLLLTGLADADSTGIIQKVGNYVYYAGEFTESTAYNFANKSINLASYAFNDAWQGATVSISFTIQAIQSSRLGLELSSYSTYAEKASAISNLSAWAPFAEPIYTDSIAIYTLSADKSYYSVRAKDSTVSGDVVILNEIDGIPVTTIEEDAFESCSGITSINIPSYIVYNRTTIYTKNSIDIYIDSIDFATYMPETFLNNLQSAFGGSSWTVYIHTSINYSDNAESSPQLTVEYIETIGNYDKFEITSVL
ncbi:MAG: hypothetical protein IJZ29_05565 [Clostridia bacterium]|nr:hypothetical protein [Clostridia bacterium]